MLIAMALFNLATGLHAQLFDLGVRASGPPCDSTLVVDFSVVDNGNMSYTFTADIDTGDVTITGLTWNLYNISLVTNTNPSFTEQFYAPGQYPVCLTVDALDPQSMPCSAMACELVTVYADSSCSSLVADFTINSINANAVTFLDQSGFNGPIASQTWDFGDGSAATGTSPTHTFSGPGPHQVCLTVTGAAPYDVCSATECKWLYLGPSNVPCSTLLQQGYLLIVVDNTVGMLDTSITSGMNYTVDWDFGDGYGQSGPLAYHTYAGPGAYTVCQTITLWGPLSPDTCVNTLCYPVFINLTGLEETVRSSAARAWPLPFTDRLNLEGLPSRRATLDLVDAVGRVAWSWETDGSTTAVLDLSSLPSGAYVLRERSGVFAIRVFKHG